MKSRAVRVGGKATRRFARSSLLKSRALLPGSFLYVTCPPRRHKLRDASTSEMVMSHNVRYLLHRQYNGSFVVPPPFKAFCFPQAACLASRQSTRKLHAKRFAKLYHLVLSCTYVIWKLACAVLG